MNDDNKQIVLAELIQKELDGLLTDQEFSSLQKILSNDTEAMSYYVRTMLSISAFSANSIVPSIESITIPEKDMHSDVLSEDMWKALAEYEKTAPEIEVPEEKPSRELIQKVVYPPREERKVSKFRVFTLMISSAAILFFVLFLRFAPEKPYTKEVATLVDQMNVQWADSTVNFKNGDRLWTNQMPVGLDKGIVKIQYDDGVDVLIEGPAKFVVERSGIYVEYGRLFSRVSASGLGFLLETPTARVVDQGTEFGVQADVNGSAELHVIKGKVQLFAGSGTNAKSSQIVTENEAVRYNANTGKTKAVTMTSNAFVRSIDSRTKTIWRGENLELAGIVAGGNGFQDSASFMGLNPAGGEFVTSIVGDARASKKAYHLVPGSKFIDGVFVPDGEQGPIPVTSAGHTFDCPNTSGLFTHEIASYKGAIENYHTTIPPAVLGGRKYEKNSIVMLHSNTGITFDLQKIRESFPDLNLKSFKAFGGVTEAISDLEADRPDIDFWILLDGQIRYERKLLKIEDGLVDFNIELNPQDHFLTLIVTDGLRPEDGRRSYPYGNDFFYLIDPELGLTERPQRP